MTHKWSKTWIVWLDSTQLGKYSKYLCKKLVFDSRSSWISGHYSTYYLTPNIGQISNIFQIARLGQVICRSLLSTIAQLIIPPPPTPHPTTSPLPLECCHLKNYGLNYKNFQLLFDIHFSPINVKARLNLLFLGEKTLGTLFLSIMFWMKIWFNLKTKRQSKLFLWIFSNLMQRI